MTPKKNKRREQREKPPIDHTGVIGLAGAGFWGMGMGVAWTVQDGCLSAPQFDGSGSAGTTSSDGGTGPV